MLGQKPLYVEIDEDVLQQTKIYCIKNNLTLRELVEELLKETVKKREGA